MNQMGGGRLGIVQYAIQVSWFHFLELALSSAETENNGGRDNVQEGLAFHSEISV